MEFKVVGLEEVQVGKRKDPRTESWVRQHLEAQRRTPLCQMLWQVREDED